MCPKVPHILEDMLQTRKNRIKTFTTGQWTYGKRVHLTSSKKKNVVSKQWNIIFSSVSLLTAKSEKD